LFLEIFKDALIVYSLVIYDNLFLMFNGMMLILTEALRMQLASVLCVCRKAEKLVFAIVAMACEWQGIDDIKCSPNL
tara:strand:- start:156 stop:386 length:231 start_codon:yes stop_codon:yes gene_type:complete